MRRLSIALLALTLILTPACSGSLALLQRAPTQTQQTPIRQQSAALADALTIAVGVIDEAGYALSADPTIPTSTKDRFDCLIKQALGDDAPSAIVVQVCRGLISGPILSRADAPLRLAMRSVQQATTDVSLANTVSAVLAATRPIWELLKQSANARLAMLGTILELTVTRGQPKEALQ